MHWRWPDALDPTDPRDDNNVGRDLSEVEPLGWKTTTMGEHGLMQCGMGRRTVSRPSQCMPTMFTQSTSGVVSATKASMSCRFQASLCRSITARIALA